MADNPEDDHEEKELRTAALETASIVLQIRQRAEQEIRRANEVLEQGPGRSDKRLLRCGQRWNRRQMPSW
jgi:hypothetical protein